MTVAGLAALAGAFGLASLAIRRWPHGPWIIGLAGIVVILLGAWALPIGVHAQIGEETLQSTGYLRLLLMLLAASGGCLTFIAAAIGGSRALPALVFVWFGATATALSMVSPVPAILLLTMGSLAAVVMAVEADGPARAMVAARGLRAIVVAGFLAALAITWADVAGIGLRAGIGDGAAPADGGALGLAYLAGAAAVALRAGAIPLHAWSSRLADGLPTLALPVTFAWGPAALAIVVLGWSEPAMTSLGQSLAVEQAVVGLLAVSSILFGSLAAYLHDDLEHVVGYSLVSDIGVVLLAVAASDGAAWGPVRLWILAYVVARSAFAGWAVVVRATFGTSRIPELHGWARRSPLLVAALVLVGLVTLGVPGLAAFDARARLIGLALDPPFDVVAWAGALAAVGYYARLLIAGFRPASAAVAASLVAVPRWPGGWPGRLSRETARQFPAAWELNRAIASAAAVLVLAGLGLVVAAGGFHGPAISAAPAPGGGQEELLPSPSPSASPASPAGQPLTGPSMVPSGSPGTPGQSAMPASPPVGGLPSAGAGTPGAGAPATGTPAIGTPLAPAASPGG
jgi:NADH:ubiquinone oxidoreductase subunit 2 (subunit N)